MELKTLIKRNIKLFFRDKGLFFTALITPVILLVLYMTFLSNIYKDSYTSILAGIEIPERMMGGLVGGQLMSSVLAVCSVTVAFCSNMLMVQDKVHGQRTDFLISPLKPHTLALSYYISTVISTVTVAFFAAAVGFIYLGIVGWYLNIIDILLVLSDVFLLVMFGTALSSIVNMFLTTQGQISAVGSVISSGYGFLCGAYMPISQFGEGLRNIISFLPGTHGMSLLRNHMLAPVFDEMKSYPLTEEQFDIFYETVDMKITLFDNSVGLGTMTAVLCVSIAVLILIYVLLNKRNDRA